MSKRDVFHNTDETTRLPIYPAGLRNDSRTDSTWNTHLEHAKYYQNLANLATTLASTPTLTSPDDGLQRLKTVAHLRTALDAVEAVLLSDTLELTSRIITENGVQDPLLQTDAEQDAARLSAHFYGVDTQSLEIIRSNFIAETALALRESPQRVQRKLFTAEGLRNLCPDTLTALAQGQITTQAARYIIKYAQDLLPEDVAHLEHVLLPLAHTASDTTLGQRARRLHERINPRPPEERHQKAFDKRNITWWSEENGMATLQVRHRAETILAIINTLKHHAAAHRDREDPRTASQYQSDLFCDSVLDGWPAGAGTPLRSRVAVTIPALDLLLHPNKAVAELEGYGPIPMKNALRIAQDAPSLIPMLTDPWSGAPIDVGRTRYRPSKALRDLLRFRDIVCCFPGCNRSAEASEADHGVAWAEGGHTTRQNMRPLCKRHQMFKHALGWQTVYRADGSVYWRSPHGLECVELPGSVMNVQHFDHAQQRTPMLQVVMTDRVRRVLGWWDPPDPTDPTDPASTPPAGRSPEEHSPHHDNTPDDTRQDGTAQDGTAQDGTPPPHGMEDSSGQPGQDEAS